MIVLSLFDGISCGRLALDRAEIKVDKYYASEIDKYAIKISNKNYPDIIQLGDINNWKNWNIEKPDLIMGGSPCQGFSMAGKMLNFEDPRSKLFFTFVEIVNYYKPKYFLLENVNMKKEWVDVITSYMGVEPILINSSLVSAQNRKRLYWTNIPNVSQPEDKKIFLKDIVEIDAEPVALHNIYGGFNENSVRISEGKSPTIRANSGGGSIPSFVKADFFYSPKAIEYMNRKTADGRNHLDFKHYSDITNNKSSAVVANFFKGVPYNVFKDWDCIRKFTPIECERLQTLPDNFTEGISDTQRYKCIGNGWTVDIIAHILRSIKK
jgi:DNA (cytosine-5)-methyltransferase 3A